MNRIQTGRRLSCLPLLLVVASIATGACSKDPGEFVASGDAYAAQGKFAEAIIEYRNAVQIDPSIGDTHRKLAEAYTRIGDRGNALAESVRAADLLPKDVGLQIRAGRMLLLSGAHDDARSHADRALAVDPRSADALVLRANALAGLNDLAAAVTEVEAALDIDPTRASAYSALGSVRMVQGNLREAEAAFKKAVETAPSSPQVQLALANFYLAAHRGTDAEETLLGILALDSKHLLAARALAYYYMGAGHPDKAEPYFRIAADNAPDVSGKLALAAFYVFRSRRAEATRILEDVARGSEGATTARLQLATLAFTAGDVARAGTLVDEVLTEEPSNTRALAARAQIEASAGKLNEALATARRATDSDGTSALAQYALGKVRQLRLEHTEALQAFNEAVRLNARLTPAKIELARLHLAAGRLTEAEAQARRALTDAPTSPEARLLMARVWVARGEWPRAEPMLRDLARVRPESADVQTSLGVMELRRGNRVAARAAFQRALEVGPGDADAARHLVALDVLEKKFGQAHTRVSALLASSPNDPDLTLLLANVLSASGDTAGAEQAARQVIASHPNALDGYVMLGRIYLATRRLDDARQQYAVIAERQPDSVQARTVIGLILEIQGKTSEARATYEGILKIDRSAAVAANNLAWIYAEQGDNLDVALDLAQTAKGKLPNQPEVADTLGWIYVRKGLPALAIPQLQQAVNSDPNNAMYLYHLGAAQAAAGDMTSARAALERSLQVDRSSATATAAGALLASLK